MKTLSTYINEELISVTKKYYINASVETFDNTDMIVWGIPYRIDDNEHKFRQDFVFELDTHKQLKMAGVKEVEIGFVIQIEDTSKMNISNDDENIMFVYVLNIYNNGVLKFTDIYLKNYFGPALDEEVEAKIIKSVKHQYEDITGLKTKYTSKRLSTYRRY